MRHDASTPTDHDHDPDPDPDPESTLFMTEPTTTTTTSWLTPELLLGGLVFVVIISIGGAIVMALGQRRRKLEPRLRALQEGSTSTSAFEPTASQVDVEAEEEEESGDGGSVVERVGKGMGSGSASMRLKEDLARAGFYGRGAASAFLGYKMMLLALGLLIAVIILLFSGMSLMVNALAGMFITAILSFIPNFVVSFRKGRRSAAIRDSLPDAVDLLEVGVTAGMGLDMAWNSVTDEIRRVSPTLADEMALTNLEMQLGASRSEAMRHMAVRTGAEELSSLVALLVQSDRFGTSIGDTLRMFAGAIREARSQRAEESAEKMAVKLLIPMVICIFPVMLIVMVGPAGLTIFKMMAEN